MENAEKRDSLNEYERTRNARIAQNKSRLQEFGILNISNSLTSLVESNKSNKRKEKEIGNSSHKKDTEYVPNFANETDDEDDELLNTEVLRKVTHSGGRQQVRFIPPRTVKRYSSSVNQGIRLNGDDLCNKKRQTARIELHFDEEQPTERQDEHIPSLALRNNRSKTTMADLILQKQKRKTGNNHDISTEKQVRGDINHFHQEALLGGEHEFDKEKHTLIASDEDRNFDSDDESLNSVGERQLDNEYAEEEESEHIDLNKQDLQQDAISKEKTRGPTMLHHVHMRTFERRKAIILNEFGQPIGPISEEDDTLSEFSRFLGTIARDYSYAPLVFDSWRNVPNKDKMWEYVLGKYIIPDEGKDWVLKSIGAAWRIYKCRFKAKHYYSYKDDKSRWKNRSKRVPDEDFVKLLATWKKKSEKVRCSRNRDRRLSQKNMHTAGPKSFARIREEMKSEHPNKEPPSLAELFERTRKRNDGKTYKESYEDTAKKIDDMKNYASPEDGNGPSDAFLGVMGKDYNGRCRLYGRGVCNKKLKKVSGGTTSSYVVPGDIIESLKDTMRKDLECEFDRLQAMRREIEETHLKKKAELENMQRDLDNDRGRMAEQVLRKVLEKLPEDIARQYFS